MIEIIRKHKVLWEEHDRWSRPEDWVKYFETEEEARAAAKETNDRNTETYAPDYYVTATYKGIVDVIEVADGKFKELK
jgi:hypothetical protein